MKLLWNQILISFILGVLLGSLVVGWKTHYWNFGPQNESKHSQKMLERFSSQLSLSPDQREKVKTLLDRKHPEMEALHQGVQAKMEALRLSTNEEIRKILSEEQQIKFERMNAKWKSRMDRRGIPPGIPPPLPTP